jgi:hypothetical protein
MMRNLLLAAIIIALDLPGSAAEMPEKSIGKPEMKLTNTTEQRGIALYLTRDTIVLLDSFDDLERMGLDQKNLLSNLHNNILREPRKKQTPIKL